MAFSCVILESDSSVLVTALNEEKRDRSLIARHDVREIMRSFNDVRVCFVRREGNSLADRYVRVVSVSTPTMSWLTFILQWLMDAAASIDFQTGRPA
jgi:hypothetical protein